VEGIYRIGALFFYGWNMMRKTKAKGGDMADTREREKYLRPDEVAALFKITVRHVYRLCEEGTFEFIRLGKTIRITNESVIRAEKSTAA
jgi:excisionase family DNA binding protein